MTQVSIRGRRAAVGRGNNRGEAAKVGGIGGEQRACRRGAQLKPRGKLRDLSVTSQGPKYRPRCWNTVDVKCLRNRKSSWIENKRSAEKHFIWLPVSPLHPHASPLQERTACLTLTPSREVETESKRTVGSDTLHLWVLFLLGVLHLSSLSFSQGAGIIISVYQQDLKPGVRLQSLCYKPRGDSSPQSQLPQSEVMFSPSAVPPFTQSNDLSKNCQGSNFFP